MLNEVKHLACGRDVRSEGEGDILFGVRILRCAQDDM
jgi:hypothetical protein